MRPGNVAETKRGSAPLTGKGERIDVATVPEKPGVVDRNRSALDWPAAFEGAILLS